MKHDFIDKYSDSDSFLHRLDPRGKIIAMMIAMFSVVSEPAADLSSFPFYTVLIIGLVAISSLPVRFVISRCIQASPFIIAAAAFYPVSYLISGSGGDLPYDVSAFTLSILFKAFAAVVMLTGLISTTGFHRMLWAFRRLKIPKSVCIVSGLMYRYIFLLTDELHRTTRARESRTPGWLRVNRFRVYGNQAAVVFLRGWERAERVYSAMVSRGFTGDFPEGRTGKLKTVHIVYSIALAMPFVIIRFLL